MMLHPLQQISTLDGEDRMGKPISSADESPMDIPGMEDFLEFLISTDNSVNAEPVNIFFILSKSTRIWFSIFVCG